MKTRKGIVLLLLLAAMAARLAGAADEDLSRGFIDRSAALAAAAAVSAEKYPDAEQVVVAEHERIRYAADGTYSQWHEQYLKVLTEEGRRANLVVSSSYTIPYQRGPEDCRIARAEIIGPDGRAQEIDVAAQSRTVVDASSMAANIYDPNEKVIQLNIGGLDVGDVLHVVMFDRIVQPRAKEMWGEWLVFEEPSPILRRVVEITGPRERPLVRTAAKSEVKGTLTSSITERGDEILYRWEARNVPQMFEEPGMPEYYTVGQRVLVSTVPDWQSVSRWYWNLCLPHLDVSPEIREKVAEVKKGAATRDEIVAGLFRFVAQEIRYMGITTEAESPGYEPHDVKETFSRRHGVCRDKAALLAAMLREAGLEAYPVLIHAGPKKDAEVPLPFFNHAIVGVRETDGRDLLMDSTDETSREFLPGYLRDKSYLAATPAGDPLRTSPPDPAEKNLLRIATQARLGIDGRLTALTELVFEGVNDNIYRAEFARMKPDEVRQFFDGVLESAVPGSRIDAVELRPRNLLNVASALTVRVEYTAACPVFREAGRALLAPPLLGARIGAVNFVGGLAGLKERKYPLETGMTCGVREELALDVGSTLGAALSLPGAQALDSEALSLRFNAGQTGSVLSVVSDFRLKALELSPAQYREFKAALREIERGLRQLAVYEDAPGNAGAQDAVVLDERVEFTLADAHTWTETRSVKKRILTYAGVKEGAEVKIEFNAGWETVRLDRASSTAPGGARQDATAAEVNLMDAPWAGVAPRYPAQKVLVASLPAVEVGSVVEYDYTRMCTNRPFFAAWESLREFDPVESKSVVLDAPAGLVRAEVAGAEGIDRVVTTNATAGRLRIEWRARGVGPVRREADLPPWWSFNPTVFLSGGEWREYARQTERRLRAAAQSREAAAAARTLGAAHPAGAPRIAALRDWIAVQVRVTPPGFDALPLDALSGADRTLADAYGCGADVAALTYAMAKTLGMKPQFVLAGSLPWIESLRSRAERSAHPGLLDTVLVRVKDPESGGWVYLNDTDQYAVLGATPHDGCMSLTLPGGELEPIAATRRDRGDVRYRLALETNGAALVTRTESVYGNHYAAQKQRFAEMTPEERRRFHESLLSRLSQGAEPAGELRTDFSAYPGRIEYAARVPDFAVRAGPLLYFELPEWPRGMFGTESDTRENPLLREQERLRSVQTEMQWPAGFAIDYAPPALNASEVGGTRSEATARVIAGADGRSAVAAAATAVRPCVVDAARYAELLRFDEERRHRGNRTIVLRDTSHDARERIPPGQKPSR